MGVLEVECHNPIVQNAKVIDISGNPTLHHALLYALSQRMQSDCRKFEYEAIKTPS